ARSGKSAEMVVESGQRPGGELASLARSGPLPNSKLVTGGAGDPPATTSFYVYGSYVDVCSLSATTECPLYNDAANETVPSAGGMTILDFGAPGLEPATLAGRPQLFMRHSCPQAHTP